MKVKTSELSNRALDWGVAVAEGKYGYCEVHAGNVLYGSVTSGFVQYRPSESWGQGGPLIEREALTIDPIFCDGRLDGWVSNGHDLEYDSNGEYIEGSDNRQSGPTPLIAAMRCLVQSKLGDEVDVPDELVTD